MKRIILIITALFSTRTYEHELQTMIEESSGMYCAVSKLKYQF